LNTFEERIQELKDKQNKIPIELKNKEKRIFIRNLKEKNTLRKTDYQK
jgi:hypothetical protein